MTRTFLDTDPFQVFDQEGGNKPAETTSHKEEKEEEPALSCTLIKSSGTPPPRPVRIVKAGCGGINYCVCSWKNCRVYQKYYRSHQVYGGKMKFKFRSNDPIGMALKASIDRNLKVPGDKADNLSKYYGACQLDRETFGQVYGRPRDILLLSTFFCRGGCKGPLSS